MSYRTEKGTGDVIIEGFENGIGDSPYEGISNLINANLVSIPTEASVNFATSQISPPAITTGTVSGANAGTYYATFTGATGLENMMTIVFSAQSGLGVTTGVPYWILNLTGSTFQITSDFTQATTVHLTNGTGTFSILKVGVNPTTGAIGIPLDFTYDPVSSVYYMLDTVGGLWTNGLTTTSGYWTYTGLSGSTHSGEGGGLAYYQAFDGASSGHRYVFVFRNQTIDYFNCALGGWTFGWNPVDGTSNNAGATLNTATTYHQAYVGQDNVLYWCDGAFLGSIFEKPDGPPQTISFDPTSTATYTYASQALALPTLDRAQCLAELGVNLLVGGKNNAIYPWNRTSTSFTYPILLAEFNIKKIVTVNTNSFIFVGNRGRIWITNGSQATLWKKIPDHISKTVEPYFQWGGACSNKNQLYFSALVTNNAGTANTNYGGVWAIDIDTKAIRLSNTLSYQTTIYNGYASALIQNFATAPAGTGIYIGWNNSSTLSGIDTTTSAPYAGGTAVAVGFIDSDLIPIGTFLKPNTNGRAEFKLSMPLVSGETVSLWYRQKFSDNFTQIGSTTTYTTNGSGTTFSDVYQNVPFENSQWVQIRAILTSTASSPSFVRLTEIRLGN